MYNFVHKIDRLTILLQTVKWHQVHSHCRTTITTSVSRTFPSSRADPLSPQTLPPLPSRSPCQPPLSSCLRERGHSTCLWKWNRTAFTFLFLAYFTECDGSQTGHRHAPWPETCARSAQGWPVDTAAGRARGCGWRTRLARRGCPDTWFRTSSRCLPFPSSEQNCWARVNQHSVMFPSLNGAFV